MLTWYRVKQFMQSFTDLMTVIKKSNLAEPEYSIMCFNPSLSLSSWFLKFLLGPFSILFEPDCQKSDLCHVVLCHDSFCDVLAAKRNVIKACWEVVLRPLVVLPHNCPLLAQEPNSQLNGQRPRLLCMDASPSSQTSGPLGFYSLSLWQKEGCRTQVSEGVGQGRGGGSEGRRQSYPFSACL